MKEKRSPTMIGATYYVKYGGRIITSVRTARCDVVRCAAWPQLCSSTRDLHSTRGLVDVSRRHAVYYWETRDVHIAVLALRRQWRFGQNCGARPKVKAALLFRVSAIDCSTSTLGARVASE